MSIVDLPARNRAIHDHASSLVVSAGAGSGKTSVLVDRVVGLVLAGTPCRDIAVVTFTEKAAGELQERLRDGVEHAVAQGKLSASVLSQLPELTITTLHGFARDLLAQAALHAAWAPDTEIVPRGLRAPGVARAVSAWRAGLATRHPQMAILIRASLDSPTKWGTAIERILATRDHTPVIGPPLNLATARQALVALRQQMQAALAACLDTTDNGYVKNRPVLDLLTNALAQQQDALAVQMVMNPGKAKGHRSAGKAPNWPSGGKDAVKAVLGNLDAWRQDIHQGLHAVVMSDARQHLLPAVEAALLNDGQATFDDLLFRASQLLVQQPAVRAHMAARYPVLLIDEVQDTDPLQARMAALLTRPPQSTGPWKQHPPQPGHLFAVGDHKQSIYRFRRADVQVWQDLKALFPSNDQLELVQNFRSVPGIVDWVNHACQGMPGYQPQTAWRGPAALDPVVRLHGLDPNECVVRHLHGLTGQHVVDRDSGQLRPLRWQDVMVVLPSWTHAEGLAQALAEAGIPSAVEGGRQFFKRQEVQLALQLMAALTEPRNTAAIADVLRGIWGLSFQDLADHHAHGGSLVYLFSKQPTTAVATALTTLLRLHRAQADTSLARLLDEALQETGASAVWSLTRDGGARLANLDKVRTLVRELEDLGFTPAEVVSELGSLEAAGDEEDLSRLDIDLEAVRITSVFKAKGREAPVVVLAHQQRGAPTPGVVLDAGQAWVQVSGKLKPPNWRARYDQEKLAFEAERARWMYVAATRARDQLVVIDDDGNLLGHIGGALPAGTHGQCVAVGAAQVRVLDAQALPSPPRIQETFPGFDTVIESTPIPTTGSLPAAAADASIRKAIAGSTRWVSVGEVARAGKTVYGVPGGVGRVGGNLVHEVMERIDLTASRAVQKASAAGLLDQRVGLTPIDDALKARCLDIVHRILDRTELDDARTAPEHWREVPFTQKRPDGSILHGVIDLAFPLDATRTRWRVIDWKSTVPPKDHPARAVYERQLQLYAKALIATVTPCTDVETALVGPHPELGTDGLPELDVLFEDLLPVVEGLVQDGAAVPDAGVAIGQPVVAEAELLWQDAKVCLLVDQPDAVGPVKALGWTVIHADSGGAGWERDAGERLAQALSP